MIKTVPKPTLVNFKVFELTFQKELGKISSVTLEKRSLLFYIKETYIRGGNCLLKTQDIAKSKDKV